MKLYKILFTLLPLLASCDDGRIYEDEAIVTEEGRTLKLTGNIAGTENWAPGYSVVVAGFNDESDYAVISKAIPSTSTSTEAVEVVMSGIDESVTRVEFCVINKLRKRILSFSSLDCSTTSRDTLLLDAGNVNVGMYATLQSQLFNTTCANCHGASTSAAAGLYLTAGRSHAALVNQPSTLVPGALLVQPGHSAESILYRALSEGLTLSWRYDHSKEVLSGEVQTMIADWIDNGAKE